MESARQRHRGIKRRVRDLVYRVPGTQALWVKVNSAFGPGPAFAGWGMQTDATPPWHPGTDEVGEAFTRVNAEVIARATDGRMVLSHFQDAQDIGRVLRELMWRHYLVFWSARYAARATGTAVKHLVECGVCDGLTAYFAMSALRGTDPAKAFLYDAWTAMRADDLLESEKGSVGAYAELSLANTQRNLAPFAGETVFVPGFVPDVFARSPSPDDVIWLHVDLNAARPTVAALEEFYDRMPPGAVILLDDYAWRGFHDTKLAADRFFAGRRGQLLPFPTGQGMFLKG